MPNIGPMEIGIVLIVALIIFGPRKLPELGRGMGSGMREFKRSITGEAERDAGRQPARLEPPESQDQVGAPARVPAQGPADDAR